MIESLKNNYKSIGVSFCLIILMTLIFYVAFATKEIQVRVIGHSWAREIQIEDFQTRNYEGWDETVPSDARELVCRRVVRSTSTRCIVRNQDGLCTVRTTDEHYDNKCTYVADRWGYNRSIVSTGDQREDTPYWNPLDFETCEALGCEREARRIPTYIVYYEGIENGSQFSCGFEQDAWASYRVDQEYSIVVRAFYPWQFCDSLRPIAG